jgi:hypothetical protein
MYKYLLLIIIPFLVHSQIPNGSFENWTEGNPDNWFTYNYPGLLLPITQSTDAQDGTYALRGEVVTFLDFPYPASLFSYNDEQEFFPVSERYMAVKGYYKFFPMGATDVLYGSVAVFDNNSMGLGWGYLEISQATGSYTEFEMQIEYIDDSEPSFMYLTFGNSSLDSNITVGSYFLLDNLSLSTVTGLERKIGETPSQYTLEQNFPNPFNPQTTISYSIPDAGYVKLVVFDNLGREVKTLVDQNLSAGSYSVDFNATDLSSGTYYYRIEAGAFNQTRRMLVIK